MYLGFSLRMEDREVIAPDWAPPPLHAYKGLIINAALTGAVPTKSDNPHVPITPAEIAADALPCARAGASIVHVHVRDGEERPVHDAGLYERAIGAIREEMPELVICATTTGRADSNLRSRMTVLDLEPPFRPDMASLTLGSFNFPTGVSYNPPQTIVALLERMRSVGIKPELEVFEPGMVNTAHLLMQKNLIDEAPYFNVLLGSLGAAPAFVGTLTQIVDRLPPESEWAAAGIGMFQPQMVTAGILLGGNVRTGLEDAPQVRGTPTTNREAVEFAVTVAGLLDRPISTPDQTRARLGLDPVRS